MAHPGGRPTDYNEDILKKTGEYLESCEDEEEQELVGMSKKGTELYKSKLRVKLPTIEGLAYHLGITRQTIYDWEKQDDKKEFSYIISDLRAKQAESLINKGLSGDYNPTIAKVLLGKHGYSDKQEIDHTTGGEKLPSKGDLDVDTLAAQLASKLKEEKT